MRPPKNSDFHWYVLYTCPNTERKVAQFLAKNKIEFLLPMHRVVRQWSDRKKTLEVPLFPCYIFVYTTYATRFEALAAPGAYKYVCFEGEPVIIASQEIDIIKKLLSKFDDIKVEHALQRGDFVKIVDGAFAGHHGILYQHKGKTRVAIQLTAIQKFLSIEIPVFQLQKVEHARVTLLIN